MATVATGTAFPAPGAHQAQPGAGVLPKILMPVDTDAWNAATFFADQYQTFLDQLAYLAKVGLIRPPVAPSGAGVGNYGFSAVTHVGAGTGTITPLVVSAGNLQPTMGTWNFVFKIIAGGAVGAATFQLSNDGGVTYGATVTTAATWSDATGVAFSFSGTFTPSDTYQCWPTDTPQLQLINSAGNARALFDHIGYPMGRRSEIRENWLGLNVPPSTVSGLVQNCGTWSANTSANMSGFSSINTGLASSMFQVQAISAVNANFSSLWSSTAIVTPLSFVSIAVEFDAYMSAIGANLADVKIGLSTTSSGSTGTPANSEAACAFLKQSGDTNWQGLTSNATTFAKVNTAVAPTAGAFQRFRIELHGSATPFGALARFFINENLAAETASNLPLATSFLNFVFAVTCVGSVGSLILRISPLLIQFNRYAGV